jgi:hypothetical protein
VPDILGQAVQQIHDLLITFLVRDSGVLTNRLDLVLDVSWQHLENKQ